MYINNNLDSLKNLTESVEASSADIAPDYASYIQLAFAISTDCGEAGREYFHRLCSISVKYQTQHADMVYSNALKLGRGDVHLGTAFHLADVAGVQLLKEEKNAPNAGNAHPLTPTPARVPYNATQKQNSVPRTAPQEGNGEEEFYAGSEPLSPLPTFSPYNWPSPLDEIIAYGSSQPQRDALLLAGFTVLGATMERFVRCCYSGRMLSPNLQCFVVAPSAAGKGVISFVRKIADPIHNRIRASVEEKQRAYAKEKMAFDLKGKERANLEPPVPPQNKLFLIPCDNSNSGIVQNVIDSDGTGLIFEVEADSVSTAINTQYGGWSDLLRKAYDHERLAYNRRNEREYREIAKVYLSVMLSGTPAQVEPLIPSAENGLFSRQLFYYMPGVRTWQNQFSNDNTDLDATFLEIGRKWRERVDRMKGNGLHTLCLSSQQQEEFNDLFREIFEKSGLSNGEEMNSSVLRLAVNLCRIISLVAMLRAMEREVNEGKTSLLVPEDDIASDNVKDGIVSRWTLFVEEADFQAVLRLAKPLYRHAAHILSFLPSTEVKHRPIADRETLYESMPDSFKRKEWLDKAEEMGINPNTASSWLLRLIKRGAITWLPDGGYQKVKLKR